jgi:hypothetical protein
VRRVSSYPHPHGLPRSDTLDSSVEPLDCSLGTQGAPRLTWVRETGNESGPYSLAVDASGMVLTAGGFLEAIHGDPAFGPGASGFDGPTVALAPDGPLFFTAAFSGTVTLGEGEVGQTTLSSDFDRGLLARFDP